MSVSTRKNPARTGSGLPFARNAQQSAQQAMPAARNAATGAIARTTPVIDAARRRAAPQFERSAHTISDSLAPAISGALLAAARRIDAPDRGRGARRGRMAGAMLVTAAAGAAGAAAAAIARRRQHDGFTASGPAGPDEFTTVTYVEEPAPEARYDTEYGGADGDVNGRPII